MDLDVAVISATVFCDLVFTGLRAMPGPGQEVYSEGFALCAGGLGANSAIALSRLGLKVGLISTIGREPLGGELYAELEKEGVNVSHVRLADDEPTAVTVSVSLPHDRCFITYPTPSPGKRVLDCERDFEAIEHARYILASASDVTADQLVRIQGMGVKVALDMGWDTTHDPRRVFDLLPFADIFMPNESEACCLVGTCDARKALDELGRWVRLAVVKLGSKGAIALHDGQFVEEHAIEVSAVDTTGAGDVFAAGLLYGCLRGWPVAKSLKLANVCGGLSTQGVGGGRSAPRWEDISRVAPDLCGSQKVGRA
ncbi:MAG: carbohydrate kinase family protein [Betaproteobacteria bacterium]